MIPTKQRTLALTVAMMTAATMTIVAGQEANERTIVGAWQTVVTPRNCQTGQPVGSATLRGLFTFHDGGTMSEFGVAPGSSPALRSPGHGVWQREQGWQEYSFAFTHYRYDASGVLIGSQEVSGTLELGPDPDEFTTRSTVEVVDPNDNLLGTFCATAAGTRFE